MKNLCLPKKCLVIMPDFIGDTVILLSFLKNLKQNMAKSSTLTIIIKSAMVELFKDFDFVDEVFDKNKLKNQTLKFLSSNTFDTIIILDFSINWSLSAYIKRIPQRITPNLIRSGIKTNILLKRLFTHVLLNTPIDEMTSQKEVYLSFLTQLGMKIFDKDIKLSPLLFMNSKKQIQPSMLPIATIHTSASFFSKKWSMEKWRKVVELLDGKFEIYWIGEKNEAENNCFENFKINDLRAQTSIKETLALLSQTKLLLSTDSAPAHLGALVEVEHIIIIYGPTNHCQWKPDSPHSKIDQVYLELPCRPCQLRFCPKLTCIRDISAQKVIDIIKSNKELFPSLSAYD